MAESKLSPLVERYFQAWIGRETWHTNHASDLTCFYRFVRAVVRYARSPISGGDLRKILIQRFTGQPNQEYLTERTDRYVMLFEYLYDFSTTEFIFPDPLIEKRDISRYYHELSVRSNHNESYIGMKMTHEWGNDWEEQMNKKCSK